MEHSHTAHWDLKENNAVGIVVVVNDISQHIINSSITTIRYLKHCVHNLDILSINQSLRYFELLTSILAELTKYVVS